MKKNIFWFCAGIIVIFIFLFGIQKFQILEGVSVVSPTQKSTVNESFLAKDMSNDFPLSVAGAYFSDGQYQKALELFKEISKTDRDGYFGMAISYYKLKQYERVIESIDKYIASSENLQNPDLPETPYRHKAIYSLRAKANFKLHRYKDWLNDKKEAGF